MGDFAGVIDMWDVVNEAVIMPVFDKYDNGITRICKMLGRIELMRTMFETARSTNPNATLLINDFDMSVAYDILIEGCLAAGIKIDVIGIQSHMHQGYWGVEKTERILSHFERFGLPIHFTETTILSGDLMPPEIVDLNDWQVDEWPSTPEGEARQLEASRHPLQDAAGASAGRGDHVVGHDRRCTGSTRRRGLLRARRIAKPAYDELLQADQGRVVAGADAHDDRRRRAGRLQRLAGRLRSHAGWSSRRRSRWTARGDAAVECQRVGRSICLYISDSDRGV